MLQQCFLKSFFMYILGPSFTTIAAFGSNGAIIHYTPTQDTDAKINSSGLFLGIPKFEKLMYGDVQCLSLLF